MSREYQICNSCVMDTTDENIVFDENGVCERCNEFKQRILPEWNYGKGHEKELEVLINEIKNSGQGIFHRALPQERGGHNSQHRIRDEQGRSRWNVRQTRG